MRRSQWYGRDQWWWLLYCHSASCGVVYFSNFIWKLRVPELLPSKMNWKFLPIGTVSYRKILFKIQTCPDSSKRTNVLFSSELLFSLSLTQCITSCADQISSCLKTLKTKLRTDLDSTLHDLLDICIEGPPLACFDFNSVIDLWSIDTHTTWRVINTSKKIIGHKKLVILTLTMTSQNEILPYFWMTGMNGSVLTEQCITPWSSFCRKSLLVLWIVRKIAVTV